MTIVTLEQVAARAGVSRSLVSLALRGSTRVSAASRQRIFDAAQELGYRPNLNARRLASGSTDILGVVLADLHNALFAEILDGFTADDLTDPQRLLLASGFRNEARERASVESLMAQQVEGIALLGSHLPDAEIRSLAEQIPMVIVGRHVEGVDSVAVDDHLGMTLVTEHLIELGHRRIAHIDGGGGAGSKPRRRAFLQTMERHGLSDHDVISGDYTELSGQEGLRRLISARRVPTAVAAANDLCAVGVMAAARSEGLAVPGDLSVTGYDNTLLTQIGYVSMTTVDYPRAELGEVARKLLMSRTADGATREPQHVLIAPTLIARDTSAAVE